MMACTIGDINRPTGLQSVHIVQENFKISRVLLTPRPIDYYLRLRYRSVFDELQMYNVSRHTCVLITEAA